MPRGSQIGQFIKRKRAEAVLQQSEKRFRTLIERSSDLVIRFDPEGAVLYASPSLERVLGYFPEEFAGDVFRFHPPRSSWEGFFPSAL